MDTRDRIKDHLFEALMHRDNMESARQVADYEEALRQATGAIDHLVDAVVAISEMLGIDITRS